MPTNLGNPVPRKTERDLPGLVQPEAQIWNRWRHNLPSGVINVYANVRIGRGRVGLGSFTEDETRLWLLDTQKRIDVILEFYDKMWIVELRRVAGAGALGRLMMYKLLYLDDPVLEKRIDLVLVSDSEDREVKRTATMIGIKYIVV